jgi:hypothetical protein
LKSRKPIALVTPDGPRTSLQSEVLRGGDKPTTKHP